MSRRAEREIEIQRAVAVAALAHTRQEVNHLLRNVAPPTPPRWFRQLATTPTTIGGSAADDGRNRGPGKMGKRVGSPTVRPLSLTAIETGVPFRLPGTL